MSRTREYRIAVKKNKIKKRKRDICNYGHTHTTKLDSAVSGEKEGLFNKSHYGALGSRRKTKTKNSYASYRHKGGYGKACIYSRHDNVQITHMNLDMKEYYNNADCLDLTEIGEDKI